MKFEELKIRLKLPANEPEDNWHRHENGGGWVQNTATVPPTAYVGENAVVFGRAVVPPYARFDGEAIVYSPAPG